MTQDVPLQLLLLSEQVLPARQLGLVLAGQLLLEQVGVMAVPQVAVLGDGQDQVPATTGVTGQLEAVQSAVGEPVQILPPQAGVGLVQVLVWMPAVALSEVLGVQVQEP